MTTHEGYLNAFNTNMVFIATLMLINLGSVWFWGFVGDYVVPEEERMEGHIGPLPCIIAWLAFFIITIYLAIRIILTKNDGSAMGGCFIAWGQAYFPASFLPSTMKMIAFGIIPLVLTVLVGRMLWLASKIEETRPIAMIPENPKVDPPKPRK